MSLDVNILPSDYIDLSIGDFRSGINKRIIDRLVKRVEKEGNGYTPGMGLPKLRKEIISYYKENYGIKDIDVDNIQITVSCLHGAFLSLKSIIKSQSDEIIVIAPFFPSYLNLIEGVGAKPVIVKSEAPDFALPKDQIKNAVNRNTKAIIINYPNNPTGASLSESDRNFLNKLCEENNIFLVDDHVYSDYPSTYKYQPVSTDISHQILVSSFSKTFAIPGIRLGYVIAPADIIERDGYYNEGITFSAPTISQFIGEIILEEPDQYTRHIEEIGKRGKKLTNLLSTSKYFASSKYLGGLYIFIKIPDEIKDVDLYYKLLEDHFHVIVAKGSDFEYSDRYFRISLSTEKDALFKGMQKIIDCVDYTLNYK